MMNAYLDSKHFPAQSTSTSDRLANELQDIMTQDNHDNMFAMIAQYQRILADNHQKERWPAIHKKLETLFKCGRPEIINGPMIGIPISIRDSDYFKEAAELIGHERSLIAKIEWMATAWNATFADTGLWMGKTFEPVSRQTAAEKTANDTAFMQAYDETTTRIGRNFFRAPAATDLLQAISLPTLTKLWNLKERPNDTTSPDFDSLLLAENLLKEKAIPYSKSGGYFLCQPGSSVVPEMSGKQVYQLNYRWPALGPTYPMTRLIDELVRIDDGIYLGQLVFATRHYSMGTCELPDGSSISLGNSYPHHSLLDDIKRVLPLDLSDDKNHYGYQNSGFFLMVDPDYAKAFYDDDAFPQLRPRPGESGYVELGYDQSPAVTAHATATDTQPQKPPADWSEGWKTDAALTRKFTTLMLEDSPKGSADGDVKAMLHEGESVLQMLQRISGEISAQSNPSDQLRCFEQLNRLFRCGIAPGVENGLFQGHGEQGFNCRVDSAESRDWYGKDERSMGFDYYHGATLNLHCGFGETFCPDPADMPDEEQIFPGILSELLHRRPPNALNIMWHNIGKYIFPWAGKSYEQISGRKLSMFLDESDDLKLRYPQRVHELKTHPASAPHYALVKKNEQHHWHQDSAYAAHLQSGAWDQGMSEADKAFWQQDAAAHWVDGNNIQDSRILSADPLMRMVDMNYRTPDPSLQAVSAAGPSPFARQGYIFLGVDDRESILPMNNSGDTKKKVFQFHYRFPMIGGPAPIGLCLDEVVELADGLYLGQLIYATNIALPFHSSVDPADYQYQLFGYFLLLDDIWQQHRLDTLTHATGEHHG
ncbi:MAG: hypothetical protein R8K50_07360 [Mariprofundus sp.]